MKKINKFLNKVFSLVPPAHFFAAAVAALSCASIVSLCVCGGNFADISFADRVSLPLFLFIAFFVFFFIVLAALLTKKQFIAPVFCYFSVFLFAVLLSVLSEGDAYFVIGLCAVSAASGIFALKYISNLKLKLTYKAVAVIVGFCALLLCILLSFISIFRYRIFNSAAFDFGIFAQTFEYMKKTFLPLNTLERSKLMSHFGVHFSPFLYILLPFYFICSKPETLLVLQAAGVALGALPVFLICRHLRLSPAHTLVWSIVYLLFPTFSAACVTDFHENKFISVLLLFAIYFALKKKKLPFFIFALLLLTVKEDCALYTGTLALWLIISKRDRRSGLILLIISIAYFFVASYAITALGDGIMSSRLNSYYTQNHSGSIGAAIRNILLDIGYFVKQIFSPEKFGYLIYSLLPLALLPFKQKHKSNFVLFIPLVVENLMLSWQYQYDIRYQYGYGSGALLILMAVLALSETEPLKRRLFSLTALTASVIIFFGVNTVRFSEYAKAYFARSEDIAATEECLSKIPDGTVLCSTFLASHLYYRDTVYPGYPIYYEPEKEPDYVVIDTRSYMDGGDESIAYANERGFKLLFSGGYAEVYGKD